MYIKIDLHAEPPTVALADRHDCGRFHLQARGAPDTAGLGTALASTGTGTVADAGDALVRVDAVRRLAGVTDAHWERDFEAMLDYARAKGWLTDDGTSIRAHVEWG
jgi:hypothetical protein